MFNKTEILIDILKEDSDELYHKERSLDEKIKLVKVMLEEINDIKFGLEHKLKNLEERKETLENI